MTERQFNERLGKAISKAQEAKGFDDRQLAGLIQCSPRELYSYKNGVSAMRPHRLLRIAQVLTVSVDELTGTEV